MGAILAGLVLQFKHFVAQATQIFLQQEIMSTKKNASGVSRGGQIKVRGASATAITNRASV